MTQTHTDPTPTELLAVAADWRSAQRRERLAAQAAYDAISDAARSGMTEAEIIRATGINRMTVRKAMGKSK